MAHQTVVYGLIEVFPSGPNNPNADARTLATLRALPDGDAWPPLVSSMFGVTANEHASVSYLYRVVHFGASLKEVEWEWSEWLAKFEGLLSELDGVVATVHMQSELVGDHTYEWHRTAATIGTWPPHWEFQGGARSFSDGRAPAAASSA